MNFKAEHEDTTHGLAQELEERLELELLLLELLLPQPACREPSTRESRRKESHSLILATVHCKLVLGYVVSGLFGVYLD